MGVRTNHPEIGSNLTNFDMTVEVSSLDPSSMTGSTGSINLSTGPKRHPEQLRNTQIVVTDDDAGSMLGRVSSVTWSESGANFALETMLNRLNVQVTVRPRLSSLEAGMSAILSQIGMDCDGLTTDLAYFPGWRGTMLDYVKHFCSWFNYEIYTDWVYPNRVMFRPIRNFTFTPSLTATTGEVQDQNLAQNIEIVDYQYDFDHAFDGQITEFTPSAVDDMQIITVNAGETASYDIKVNGWIATVTQPVVMDLVGPEVRTDAGAYCVAGADGLPITAAQWTGEGGSLTVSLTDEPDVLHVEVQAPAANLLTGEGEDGDRYGPYSIAATTTEGQLYNSLHITGTGLLFDKVIRRMPTAVPMDVSSEEVGATIDNPWVSGISFAYRLGVRAAQSYSGPTYTRTFTTPEKLNIVVLAGSRIPGDEVMFRATSVTVSPTGTTLTATMDTTFEDFETKWAGETFADFNAVTDGMTFGNWSTVPLKRV